MDMRVYVWVEESFFNNDKWWIKLLSEFYAIDIQHFMSDSNSKNNNSLAVENFTNGYEGMCMSRGKFIKPWQVTDKIIEWIFMEVIINILWVILTQKIITRRVLKIDKWFQGDVYE